MALSERRIEWILDSNSRAERSEVEGSGPGKGVVEAELESDNR